MNQPPALCRTLLTFMPPPVNASHKSLSKVKTPSSAALPKDWPRDVIYLVEPQYSPKIDRHILQGNKSLNEASSSLPIISSLSQAPHIIIKPITNPTHPATNQHGLFTTQTLPPGTFVLPYLGYVHGPIDTDPTSDYDLTLDAELGIAVDAARMGNEARFINDYRGVSDTGPNAEFRDVLVDIGQGRLERRIGVFVLSAGKAKSGKQGTKRVKGVLKGEEILVSYGKGFWKGRKGGEGGEEL